MNWTPVAEVEVYSGGVCPEPTRPLRDFVISKGRPVSQVGIMSTAPKTEQSADADFAALRRDIVRPRLKVGRWLARLAVIVCVFVMWQFSGEIARWLPSTTTVLWKFQNREAFFASLRQFGWCALAEAAPYFLLGVLIPRAIGKPKSERGTLKRGFFIMLLGLGLTFVVCAARLESIPAARQLAFPVLGCLIGLRIGCASFRGIPGLLWLIPQTLTHLLLFTLGILGLVYFAADVEPLALDEVTVSPREKRRLMKLIRHSAEEENGSVRRLRLTEDDLNQLAAWGLQTADVPTQARLQLVSGNVKAEASQGFAIPQIGVRYFNFRTSFDLQVTDGKPVLQVNRLQVGHLSLPPFVCRYLSGPLLRALLLNEETRQIADSLESVQIEEGALELAVNKDVLKEQVLPSLKAKLGIDAGLITATSDHLRHLVRQAEGLPGGDARFVALLQTSMRFARERSVQGDPLRENRAAVMALGILLGHSRVADISGAGEATRFLRGAHRRIGRVTIRGRSDWTKHFWVSAALVVLSDESTSDVIGVLKEELDAGGGSGFSFADLLADRAGTLFARAATRDVAAARGMQERFAGDISLDALFPAAADLPEGISGRALQTRYGGIGGPGYRDIERDIERRLAGCELLR